MNEVKRRKKKHREFGLVLLLLLKRYRQMTLKMKNVLFIVCLIRSVVCVFCWNFFCRLIIIVIDLNDKRLLKNERVYSNIHIPNDRPFELSVVGLICVVIKRITKQPHLNRKFLYLRAVYTYIQAGFDCARVLCMRELTINQILRRSTTKKKKVKMFLSVATKSFIHCYFFLLFFRLFLITNYIYEFLFLFYHIWCRLWIYIRNDKIYWNNEFRNVTKKRRIVCLALSFSLNHISFEN